MKFKYKRYASSILRPVIPIEVEFNDMQIPYSVLVDSGADMCIFDIQIAELLGIDISKGIKQQVIGVTGYPEYYYIHRVNIYVGGWKYKVDAGFMEMRNSQYGIVGQNGFFSQFIVKFDLLKSEIELKRRI